MSVIFVYERDGKYKCFDGSLSGTFLAEYIDRMNVEGWRHVATLNANRWIENTLNTKEVVLN